MISINFFVAIAAYLFLFILLLFSGWLLYNNEGKEYPSLNVKFFQQCPVCSHIFFNDEAKDVLICPRCSSIIKAGKEG